jgi:hypothetical protein
MKDPMLVIVRITLSKSLVFILPNMTYENKATCPEDETGKISVIPWMIPKVIYLIISMK